MIGGQNTRYALLMFFEHVKNYAILGRTTWTQNALGGPKPISRTGYRPPFPSLFIFSKDLKLNFRIMGQYTHNLLGLKPYPSQFFILSKKIWINGSHIGFDMPSALSLVSYTCCFFRVSFKIYTGPVICEETMPEYGVFRGLRGFFACREKKEVFKADISYASLNFHR